MPQLLPEDTTHRPASQMGIEAQAAENQWHGATVGSIVKHIYGVSDDGWLMPYCALVVDSLPDYCQAVNAGVSAH